MSTNHEDAVTIHTYLNIAGFALLAIAIAYAMVLGEWEWAVVINSCALASFLLGFVTMAYRLIFPEVPSGS